VLGAQVLSTPMLTLRITSNSYQALLLTSGWTAPPNRRPGAVIAITYRSQNSGAFPFSMATALGITSSHEKLPTFSHLL
jgi:hypothetical protein